MIDVSTALEFLAIEVKYVMLGSCMALIHHEHSVRQAYSIIDFPWYYL